MVASVLSSLRARLVLLVLFALIPAFGLILWTNLEQRRTERDHVRDTAENITQSISAQEDQVVQNARELLSNLTVLPQVAGSDLAACQEYLAQVKAIESRYSGFGVANTQGDIYCWDQDVSPHVNIADRAYFQRVVSTNQFSLGGYVIARNSTKAPALAMAYPMFDAQGKLVAMMATGVTLDWLNDFSARIALPGDSTLTVIDANGVVLARRPDPETWVGKSVTDKPLGQTVLTSGQGSAELTGLDGKQRLFAYSPLGGAGRTDAYVAVGISTSTAYAGVNHALHRNLGLLGLVSVLALAAAWFGGDRLVVRNVRALARTAKRIQSGDLSARSGLRYDRGEIGQLAWTFDETAQALEQREAARQRAEEALRESEELFRLSVEKVEDYAIFMLDPDGLVASWNAGAERIKGYRAEEIIGQHCSRFYPLEDIREGKPERDIRIAEEEGRAEHESWRVRKDGSRFWASVVTTAMRDERGKLRGFSKVTRDLTSQKRAEDALQRTLEDLQRSNTELEQFAYVASHDLQEPLRMVGNYTQLLARRYEGKLDADADDFIGYAVEGAKRMQTLIDDLLAFSRVGTRGKEPSEIDAEAVLERTLRDLAAAATEAEAEITHDPLPVVLADDGQLGQLFQNLIGNAIKFRGEAPPRVHVAAQQNGRGYVFSVKDNGIGIDPEYFERIFVIFQRLHGRGQYPGTGMGLAICKKIVERHGGRIWVESESGRGTTLFFTMPAPSEAQAAA